VYALLHLGAPIWERLPMPHAQSAPRVRPELSPARACHRDDFGLSAVKGGSCTSMTLLLSHSLTLSLSHSRYALRSFAR